MIKGKQAVLDYFSSVNAENDNTLIHFSIFKKGTIEKGYPAITTPGKKEGWNYHQAYDFLSQWLSWQQYGEFTIVVNDREQITARGGLRQDFSIEQGSNVAAIAGPQFTPEDINAQVEQKVNAILEKREKEKELAELKAKLTELEKQNKELDKAANDPWNKVISGIEPYVPDILKDMGIIKHKVAGIPQSDVMPVQSETVTEQDEQIQQRSEKALGKIIAARPADWLELLERIGNALEKDHTLADKVKMFI